MEGCKNKNCGDDCEVQGKGGSKGFCHVRGLCIAEPPYLNDKHNLHCGKLHVVVNISLYHNMVYNVIFVIINDVCNHFALQIKVNQVVTLPRFGDIKPNLWQQVVFPMPMVTLNLTDMAPH